jgi:hypothetical protein
MPPDQVQEHASHENAVVQEAKCRRLRRNDWQTGFIAAATFAEAHDENDSQS